MFRCESEATGSAGTAALSVDGHHAADVSFGVLAVASLIRWKRERLSSALSAHRGA